MSNLKQMYTAAALYANEHDDKLPPFGSTSDYSNAMRAYSGRVWGYSTTHPTTNYLRNYLGVDYTVSGTTATLASTDNAAYCPAAYHHGVPGDSHWNHQIDYALLGFGQGKQVDGDWPAGTTRLSALGTPGKLGTKLMFQDVVYYNNTGVLGQNNHQEEGGNALVGDGSAEWLGMEHFKGSAWGAGVYISRVHYSQSSYGNRWNSTDGPAPAWQLIANYPDGTQMGMNNQSDYWGKNRKMFGY
jgi:hypothetical protein